jgi:malate dehydrogenase (oxaloacetate-decarboxylating)
VVGTQLLPLITPLRGADLLNDPRLNKGTAFSREERHGLGLEALLPWRVETLEQQAARCWHAFQELGSDLERYAFAQHLRERNHTLFHRFLADHVEVVMPIVYTPTVGKAIQHFSRTYRTPSQGVYLAAPQQDDLVAILRQACPEPPDLMVVTDAQGILGIGDQGAGGIHICQGKLAVYTLCAGLDPARALPVMLDVGTDSRVLIDDPDYPGLPAPRLEGQAYDTFLDRFVAAVRTVCPNALVQWEDFGATNARRVLDAYRHQLPSFNDDIQGTSGVATAAILAGLRGLGRKLADQRFVIFGAGTAGCGIAERLQRLLQREGLDAAEAADRLWLLNRHGLVQEGMAELSAMVRPYAKSRERLEALRSQGLLPPAHGTGAGESIGLRAVIEAVRPGVLIGTSTVAGAFDQAVVEALCRGVERPIVLPLSNPTTLAEVTPENLLRWSEGRALVATGSPFQPVMVNGRERVIGQCNNCFVFPGLGFAAMAVGAREVSEAMIDASIAALAATIPAATDPEAPLMPPLAAVQAVSRAVAEAVAVAAVEEGLAGRARTHAEALQRLEECTWRPVYGPVLAG